VVRKHYGTMDSAVPLHSAKNPHPVQSYNHARTAGMAGPADGGMEIQKAQAAGGRAPTRFQGDNNRPYNDREGTAPGPLPTTGILRLRGLPFGATREDVAEWFNDSGVLLQPINAAKQAPHSLLCLQQILENSLFI